MNLRDACLKAKKEGRGITRKSYGQRSPIYLHICLPTQQLVS